MRSLVLLLALLAPEVLLAGPAVAETAIIRRTGAKVE